jgi:hypothetical protein
VSRTRELLAALTNANVAGFLSVPPGLDGQPSLGLAGVHGVPRARTWDAVVSAGAPGLVGRDAVAFVVLVDGTVVVDDDLPDGSLVPLADAVERTLPPPYRAAAVRNAGDVWSVVAERVVIVELPRLEGDEVDLTVVNGDRNLNVDGERTIRPVPALDALVETHGDAAMRAERVDGDLFAVDVFPL